MCGKSVASPLHLMAFTDLVIFSGLCMFDGSLFHRSLCETITLSAVLFATKRISDLKIYFYQNIETFDATLALHQQIEHRKGGIN